MRLEMLNPVLMLLKLQKHRRFFMAYLSLTGVMNLIWEILQLPLYTLWDDSMPSTMALAVVHCTLGDVLIGFVVLLAALILAGANEWPYKRYWKIALVAGALGLAYTAFSEWRNTVVTRSWEYSDLMPTLWGIGLSPLAQWCVIPGTIFCYLRRTMDATSSRF